MNTAERMAAVLSLRARIVLIVLPVILSACATADDGPFSWYEGWRKAEVLEVARPADMQRPRFFKCIRNADPRDSAATFVVVKYLERGRAKRTAVHAPAGDAFRVGDLVFVNIGDCSLPPVRRQTSPRPTASAPKAG